MNDDGFFKPLLRCEGEIKAHRPSEFARNLGESVVSMQFTNFVYESAKNQKHLVDMKGKMLQQSLFLWRFG